MRLRPAEAADLPACAVLLGDLFSSDHEFEAHLDRQLRGLELILSQPQVGTLWVAELNGGVVGMVNLLFSVSTALGGPVATLEDLVVAPAVRGSGIGTALLQAALDVARGRGCVRVTLLTDHDNTGAQRLYRRFGFQASTMVPLRLEF